MFINWKIYPWLYVNLDDFSPVCLWIFWNVSRCMFIPYCTTIRDTRVHHFWKSFMTSQIWIDFQSLLQINTWKEYEISHKFNYHLDWKHCVEKAAGEGAHIHPLMLAYVPQWHFFVRTTTKNLISMVISYPKHMA